MFRLIFCNFESLPVVFQLPDEYKPIADKANGLILNCDDMPDEVINFLNELHSAAYHHNEPNSVNQEWYTPSPFDDMIVTNHNMIITASMP